MSRVSSLSGSQSHLLRLSHAITHSLLKDSGTSAPVNSTHSAHSGVR